MTAQQFIPTTAFWAALKAAVPRGVTLVDVYCGRGERLAAAAAHGINMIGIEVERKPGQDRNVLIRDPDFYPWRRGVWPLFCLPQVSAGMSRIMTSAREVGAHAIYVDLTENYYANAGKRESRALGVVGQESERMYLFSPFKEGARR